VMGFVRAHRLPLAAIGLKEHAICSALSVMALSFCSGRSGQFCEPLGDGMSRFRLFPLKSVAVSSGLTSSITRCPNP
jgi:hypothetical protein